MNPFFFSCHAGNAESREEECVLESGSPNTSSLGLLASYGYSSSEEEDERKAKESVKESQKSGLFYMIIIYVKILLWFDLRSFS